MSFKRLILTAALLISSIAAAFADGTKDDVEVLYKYQFSAEVEYKIIKGLSVNFSPELRFCEGYDKLLLNAGVEYKMFGCIHLGATYRLDVDRVEGSGSSYSMSGFGNNYDSEVSHRYAFDVTYKEKFGRFTPSFRVRYNNFTDEDIDDKEFLRYRAKVDYNIRKCKITPYLSVEAYQDLTENLLYKMRYATGFDFDMNKKSAISLDYKFDFYCLEYKNANIFSVGYKYKF
ncbi:MAG: DUF2490 domain-containing protein [Rikenellaceae bacterium]